MMTPLAIINNPAPLELSYSHTLVTIDDHAVVACGPLTNRSDADLFMDRVAEIHEQTPCVPLRFDPEPTSPQQLGRLLRSGRDRFTRLLSEFHAADEWSICIESGDELAAVSPASPTTGRGYLLARRTTYREARGISAAASDYASRLALSLAGSARDHRVFPTARGGASLVLLVDRCEDLSAAFAAATTHAALPVTLTGPWPPFSFTTLIEA